MKLEKKVVAQVFDSVLSQNLAKELYNTSYLEKYLLLSLESDYKYVVSCICMVNEHFKSENGGKYFLSVHIDFLTHIIDYIIKIIPNLDESDNKIEDWVYGEVCLFLYNLFLSVDCDQIQVQVLSLVSPTLLLHLSQNSRDELFEENEMVKEMVEEEVEGTGVASSLVVPWILSRLILSISSPTFPCLSNSLQLIALLLSQIPSRRFVIKLVKGSLIVPQMRLLIDQLSSSFQDMNEEEEEEERKDQTPPPSTFSPQMVSTLTLQLDLVDWFIHFPIEEMGGEMVERGSQIEHEISTLYSFQKEAFQLAQNPSRFATIFEYSSPEICKIVGLGENSSIQPGDEEELRDVSFLSSQQLGSSLRFHLNNLSTDLLQYFVCYLELLEDFVDLMGTSSSSNDNGDNDPKLDGRVGEVVQSREFLTKVMINHLSPPHSSFDTTSHQRSYTSTSLYPTEESLFYSPQHPSNACMMM